MRRHQRDEIISSLSETGDDLAAVMGLTPDFVSDWGQVAANCSVFTPEEVLLPALSAPIEELQAFEAELAPAGLPQLQDRRVPVKRFVDDLAPYMGSPYERVRTNLTRGFMISINAVKHLGEVEITDRHQQKLVAHRTQRLSQTLTRIVVGQLGSVHLPPTLTKRQVDGLQGIAPLISSKPFGLREAVQDIIDNRDDASDYGVEVWQAKLQYEYLQPAGFALESVGEPQADLA